MNIEQDVQNTTANNPDTETIEQNFKAMFNIPEDSEESAPSEDEQQSEEVTESGTETGTSEPAVTEDKDNDDAEQTSDDTEKSEERDILDGFTSKQNKAFAEMRTQNKALSDLIMNLAKASGVSPKDTDEAVELLKDNLTTIVAKERNLPEEVLRELESKDKALAELKQYKAQENALKGLQKVKDLHGLEKEHMQTFADTLVKKGVDIYADGVDLVKEYRNIYFEDAVKRAREEGRQAEIKRSMKAQNSSTTPSTQKGAPEDTGSSVEPVKSIKDLEKLLSGLK